MVQRLALLPLLSNLKRVYFLVAVLGPITFGLLNAFQPTPTAIALEPVVTSGLEMPVYLANAGDGSGRLFVVELKGRIRIIRDGVLLDKPYLDMTSEVKCCQEQGLFSVAFDPDYKSNGTFYVDYTDRSGNTAVTRYVVADPAADVARPVSVRTLLSIDKPYFNHNAGQLQFGPNDGYLYISVGDGGGPGDPEKRGQSLDTLLGKMLRINVREMPTYTIPATNPFIHETDVRPEIWAYGLRNPWRFSFDRATGDMYIADVGASCYEEINFEPAYSGGGLNYGWRQMEGRHAFNPDESHLCTQPKIFPSNLVLPVVEYSRRLGNAVTGGYVYRGREYPWLNGVYFYGDFASGRIWSLRQDGAGKWVNRAMLDTTQAISSFGEAENGELYVVAIGGSVFKIVARN